MPCLGDPRHTMCCPSRHHLNPLTVAVAIQYISAQTSFHFRKIVSTRNRIPIGLTLVSAILYSEILQKKKSRSGIGRDTRSVRIMGRRGRHGTDDSITPQVVAYQRTTISTASGIIRHGRCRITNERIQHISHSHTDWSLWPYSSFFHRFYHRQLACVLTFSKTQLSR
jgi:hypothetical protein